MRVKLALQRGRSSTVAVHRLVALTFLGPPPSPRHEVRHIDGSRDNNRASNIAWGTHQDNVDDIGTHGRRSRWESRPNVKLTAPMVALAKSALATGVAMTRVARALGVTGQTVQAIMRGRTWTHVAPSSDAEAVRRFTAALPVLTRKRCLGEANQASKLRAADIPVIRAAIEAGESGASIASRYNVSHGTIAHIKRGRIWKHVA